MRASDFAIAALYTLSVLDKEVAKLQAPGGSKQRPADAYAIVEVTVYIARNLRRAISVGQELGMTTTKMLMLCDSVEGALAKDDLPGAASALLSDSPAGKWVREVLQKLCTRRGCRRDSLGNSVSNAARFTNYTRIATGVSNVADDLISWLLNNRCIGRLL